MINRTKQDWSVGSTVKIGFLSLIVRGAYETPGDYKPDAYLLSNDKQTNFYRFVPHNGLEKISADEFTNLLK